LLYPKKNLIPPFTSDRWFNDSTIAGGTLTPDLFNDYRAVFNITTSGQGRLIHIPVELGKTYIFSYGIMSGLYRIYKRKVTYHIDPLWIAKNGEAFTVDSSFEGYVTLRITNSALGNFVFENMQLEEGTVKTPFERLKWINKPAKLYPKQNLVNINDPRWTMRQGTTYVKKSGSRITWDADRDYAGYQIFLNDADFVGKTVTFGGKRHPDTSVLLFYKKPDGSSAYVGLASFEEYRTMSIPKDAFELRFYVQNNPSTRGEFWSEDLYINIGDKVGYTPYELINKPAALVVKKNYVEPFTEWYQDNDITVNFIERTESRMVFDITTPVQYKGIRMPIKWDRLKNLLGKKVTLSARTFDKTNLNNSQIQLRFTGGKANTDMVLNMGSLVTTKDVATDHTGAFLVVQMNVAGTARITLEGLQLEVGDTKTDYEPLKMVNKPAVLFPELNLLNVNDGDWVSGSADGNWTPFVDSSRIRKNKKVRVKSNTKYTLKVAAGYQIYIRQFASESSFEIGTSSWRDDGYTFTTEPTVNFVGVILRRVDNTKIDFSELPNIKPMLAEGEQTTYKPYKEINKPARLYTKNLVKPFSNKDWSMFTGVEVVNDNKLILHGGGNWDVSKITVPVEVGKPYTLSVNITGGAGASVEIWEDGVINIGSFAKDLDLAGGFTYRTYTPTRKTAEIRIVNSLKGFKDAFVENLQLEQGTAKTTFEPYKLGNKPL
jgi:hypothetical protein